MAKSIGLLFLSIATLLVGISVAYAGAPLPFQYISPLPGGTLVSAGTTIAVRHGEMIDRASVSDALFEVTASQSGVHAGHGLLAEDDQTVIFVPDRPFAPGKGCK